MKKNLVIAALLVASGIALMLLRTGLQTHVGVSAGDTVWQMDWEVNAKVTTPPASIRFYPPAETSNVHVVKQELLYPGLRLVRAENRELIVEAEKKKEYFFQARYFLQLRQAETVAKPQLTAKDREIYLQADPFVQLDGDLVQKRSAEISERARDNAELIELIFQITGNILTVKQPGQAEDAETVLRTGRGGELGKTRVMIALCRTQNIPARIITGFKLEDDIDAVPSYWVEVYQSKAWVPYDPTRGHRGSLPVHYFPIRHDGAPHVFVFDGAVETKINYQIVQDDSPVGKLSSRERRLRDLFDLSRLPLDMRNTLALILMLPFGALFTFAFRQFTGLNTYGTFTPSLLALAAVYADPITAVVIFGVVAAIGSAGRATAITRALTRLPRLAVVFTLVALAMTLAVSVMDYYYLNPMGHIVLLPIVVLTSFIDRVYTTFDDLGMRQVVIRLVGTVIVTVCCFVMFSSSLVADWIVNFPETHFITLGFVVLISLYKKKKLVDLSGFTWLKQAQNSKNQKRTTEAAD